MDRTRPPQLRRGRAHRPRRASVVATPLDGGGPSSCAGREDAALRHTRCTTQSLTRGDSRGLLIDQIAARVHCFGRSRYDDDHGVDPQAGGCCDPAKGVPRLANRTVWLTCESVVRVDPGRV